MILCISNRLFINFSFWNFYRYVGSCKTSTERLPCILHPVSPDSYISCNQYNALQPKTHQEHTSSWTSWVYYLLQWWRAHTVGSHGTSQSVVERTYSRIWALVGWFGGHLRKWGSLLIGCSQKAGAILWWGVSNLISREKRQHKDKAVFGKEAADAHFRQGGEIFGILWVAQWPGFCQWLRQNDEVDLFCLILSW